jgi:RNA polymerase sigma factor (sigma-70 family)
MNDLEFVQRCVKKDKDAWDEFLKKYSRLIYTYIHNVLSAKGANLKQEQINDIFQDLFCALIQDNYKKLKSFKARNECSLASWLRQVTINFTIDYIRKLKPTVSIDEEIDEGRSLKDIIPDSSPEIRQILSDKERLKGLKDCIAQLNIDEKYFLELSLNRRISLEGLKDHLRVSRGAVDMRKSRILDKLKKCFQSKGLLLD